MRRKKKNITLIIVFGVLLLICVFGIVFASIKLHTLWLNEFNAQIEKFGFYKQDIQVLNQSLAYIFPITLEVVSIIGTIISLIGEGIFISDLIYY